MTGRTWGAPNTSATLWPRGKDSHVLTGPCADVRACAPAYLPAMPPVCRLIPSQLLERMGLLEQPPHCQVRWPGGDLPASAMRQLPSCSPACAGLTSSHSLNSDGCRLLLPAAFAGQRVGHRGRPAAGGHCG